jgi:hypothetical protein
MADAYKRSMLELANILEQAKKEERALGRNITSQDKLGIAKRVISRREERLQRFEKEIVDIDGQYKPLPASALCFPYMTGLGQENQSADNEAYTFAEWLHWERHRESLQNATEADKQGNLSAWDRIARTAKEWRTIVFKKGTIKPFQGGIYHRDIFQFGLSFASGMEKLTGEELAEFFDFYCPCGKTHDARALQKQLVRLLKDLEAAARKS